jgi:ribosomal subunit interface protein
MRPVRIHFMDSPRSEAVAAKIEARVDHLARFSDEIQNCEVWLESPHGHHRQGPLYAIRIRLTVPGEEITIERQPETDDVYVAIRQAFDAARRKLEDHDRRRRGQVKAHPRAPGAHGFSPTGNRLRPGNAGPTATPDLPLKQSDMGNKEDASDVGAGDAGHQTEAVRHRVAAVQSDGHGVSGDEVRDRAGART